jgi:DNA-binding IclR family transcriptional regulator
VRSASRTAQKGPFFQAMPLPVCVIAAGLPAFTRHTITSPDVLRQRLSVIRSTADRDVAQRIKCGKAAIAMPIFYGAGRVAAAIELTGGDLGSELKPAASALSVACRSLSRQLATEFRVRGNRNGQKGSHARQRNS